MGQNKKQCLYPRDISQRMTKEVCTLSMIIDLNQRNRITADAYQSLAPFCGASGSEQLEERNKVLQINA